MRRLIVLAVAALVAWAGLTGGAGDESRPPLPPAVSAGTGSGTGVVSDAVLALAGAQLDGLAVKGRAPKTGYARSQFGPRWSDDVDVEYGRDGCNTQANILRRDLTAVTIKPRTRGCVVLSGRLLDPYTGQTITYRRGQSPTLVNVDHVVALGDSWQKGAQQLSPDRRRDLANDPVNLLAVSASTNAAKRDSDAASWLPPNRSFRCGYAARQIQVKAKYHLWVTPAEKTALSRILTSCTRNGDTR